MDAYLNEDVFYFFDRAPGALPLYEAFAIRVFSEISPVRVQAKKTQISFANRRIFACVSVLPVRKAAERPKAYITVSFGLGRRLNSERVDAVAQPYPNRYTHHVLVSSAEQIDDELIAWVREASEFSANKR